MLRCPCQVLQGVVPGVPVWLQFVGLSVPEGVHRQQQQLDSGVAAAFFRVRGSGRGRACALARWGCPVLQLHHCCCFKRIARARRPG